jgi:Flp pilus assembly protein TadD
MADPHDRPARPHSTNSPWPPEATPHVFPEGDRAEHADSEPPSTNFAGEDFLFHLYRGSELLEDNCIEEAKEELERALAMQPRDPEGQALLGVVYFRLGLYPRAIEIYQELVRTVPREIAPRMNLGLCYLKTGQPVLAREALEEVIRRAPEHKRAWGYLGLVYERLGDPAKALAAFERGGQTHLVHRMEEALAGTPRRATSEPPPDRQELRRAVADLVRELDAQPGRFEAVPATQQATTSPSGKWSAIELGREESPSPSRRLTPASPDSRATWVSAEVPLAGPSPPARRSSGASLPVPTATTLAELSLLALPDTGVRVLADDMVAVRVTEALSARLGAVRALLTGGEPFRVSPAFRRWRGRPVEEPLGGVSATLALLEGSGHVLLGASPGARLVAVRLDEEFLYVRESLLVSFESMLRYENGRLVRADGKPTPMVQLSGSGHVVFEVSKALGALDVRGDHAVTVEADRVVGWTGRLLPGSTRKEPAPVGLGGLVVLSGEGAVFVELG